MTAPEWLKAHTPFVRQIQKNVLAYGYVKGTKEYDEAIDTELSFYRKFVVYGTQQNELIEISVVKRSQYGSLQLPYCTGAKAMTDYPYSVILKLAKNSCGGSSDLQLSCFSE